MAQTQQSSVVLEACNQNKAFENLQYCNDTIEKVVKSINAYLHEKQLQFPRFFFLSNEDLLHILSQTKEPLQVQDHLNKCFEGIDRLEFEAESLVIKGMYSNMSEYVAFEKQIDPFEIKIVREEIEEDGEITGRHKKKSSRVAERKVKEVRPIEEWLTEVQE